MTTTNNSALVEALEFIRDSTFRDAATLRIYADKALNEYRSNSKLSEDQYERMFVSAVTCLAEISDALGLTEHNGSIEILREIGRLKRAANNSAGRGEG